MDDVAGGVDCGQHSLPVDQQLDGGFLAAEEAELYLVETGGHREHTCLVLLPQEVLRTGVHALDLPGNCEPALQLPGLPQPSGHAVLSAKGLVDGVLLGKGLLELAGGNLDLDLIMDLIESFVNVVDVYIEYINEMIGG